jgi:peptidoglycan hydrolase-like protein with peptidoglycan-binding domain
VRKVSQRKGSLALDDERPSATQGWRKDAIAALVAVAALSAVVANAAYLQSGPHPAPLFAAKPVPAAPAPKSIRVVGQEITGPAPQAALPKSRPVEAALPKAELPKTDAPKTDALKLDAIKAETAKPEQPTVPRPRNEVIADIQRELSRRGFYDGAADGVLGPKTNAAMRDFEQASGLRPGSEPNEVFLRALTRSPAKGGQRAAAPQTVAADPIAELIAPSSKRIFAVQRALTDFGYGQFRPNGTFGPETKHAIEQFERARKLPITGQISPRLMRELAVVTGRELD